MQKCVSWRKIAKAMMEPEQLGVVSLNQSPARIFFKQQEVDSLSFIFTLCVSVSLSLSLLHTHTHTFFSSPSLFPLAKAQKQAGQKTSVPLNYLWNFAVFTSSSKPNCRVWKARVKQRAPVCSRLGGRGARIRSPSLLQQITTYVVV